MTSFVVLIPTHGRFGMIDEVSADPVESTDVPQPSAELRERNLQFAVWINRADLESHVTAMLAQPLPIPLHFQRRMDLTEEGIRAWLNIIPLLLRGTSTNGTLPSAESIDTAQAERLLFRGLLMAQPNNYSVFLGDGVSESPPRSVQEAVEVMEARAADPLTTEDVARAVGVGTRTLQEKFKRHKRMTPMSYLRAIRMRHVAKELLAAHPTQTTVSRVAARWGFQQPGRFSTEYRRWFGEPPSSTLRR